METVRTLLATACAGVILFVGSAASAQTFGPSTYVQTSNSPFSVLDFTGGYFHLEDFEDGALNTPGASALGGAVAGPSNFTDSVDADDGFIDGLGRNGHSYIANGFELEFVFSDAVLGNYPTHVGIVWTDVGNTFGDIFGVSLVEVFAFDPDGVTIGFISSTVGDGRIDGTTADDRFFGFEHAGGIASLLLVMPNSQDWEVDHLQYGYVPEPATLALLGLSVVCLRRRR